MVSLDQSTLGRCPRHTQKLMANLHKINRVRKRLDRIRQPEHESVLDHLDKISKTHNLEPYSLSATPGAYDELMKHSSFSQGAQGLHALAPTDGYIYRVSTLSSLINHCSWLDDHTGSVRVAFGNLLNDFKKKRNWLSLSDYAHGRLSSHRNFTWWTNKNIKSNTIVSDLHRIGIANDWIFPFSVILRCSVELIWNQDILFVPTVVDAYDLPIFRPTATKSNPLHGNTIDIRHPSQLASGFAEYSVTPIPSEHIEFQPVKITAKMKGAYPVEQKDLYASLENYYQKLEEE